MVKLSFFMEWNMKKNDLIKMTAKRCEMPEARTREVVKALIDVIGIALKDRETVTLNGLGRFYTTNYKARQIKSPQGNICDVPEHIAPRFKPSKKLKQIIG